MTNAAILKANPKLLTTIEKQKFYVLNQALAKMPCPNCATRVNQFDAAGLDDVDHFTFEGEDRTYHCPKCSRQLLFIVQLQGPWVWRLVPENVSPDLDTAEGL